MKLILHILVFLFSFSFFSCSSFSPLTNEICNITKEICFYSNEICSFILSRDSIYIHNSNTYMFDSSHHNNSLSYYIIDPNSHLTNNDIKKILINNRDQLKDLYLLLYSQKEK